MTITIEISAAIIGRFDRLMDYLEGKQVAELQRIIDEQTAALKNANDEEQAALERNK